MHSMARAVLAASIGVAAMAEITAANFELVLPDLNKVIGPGNVVADIPANRLSRITIELRGSADKNLDYGEVNVRINGKGVGNIFNSGANERGKFLAMDASTAANRHDSIFDSHENTIEVYGKDRRGRGYYQNWILRSGSDNTNALFTYLAEVSPTDEIGVPPDLNLVEPKAPIVFAGNARTATVHIRGTAGASSGIATLTVNSKPVPGNIRGGIYRIDETVNVLHGENAVTIEVTDKKGNRRSITIPVSYPSARTQRLRMSGERFALLIGVSRFGPAADAPPPITAAAADARMLAETFRNAGFRPENVRLLTDEQATAERVRTALGDFTARAKPEDLLVVFVATHGVHDPSAPEKIYIAGVDTQRRALRDTAIEISELQLLLNRALRCRHTLLFFDVEHQLGPEWTFAGKPVIDSHLLNLFNGSAGPSILVSAAAGQDSQQRNEGSTARGVFAAALAEGISGPADTNQDGVVTPRELCAYVSQAVRSASGNQQSPQYRFSGTEADAPVLSLGH
jgi:Caspase domain